MYHRRSLVLLLDSLTFQSLMLKQFLPVSAPHSQEQQVRLSAFVVTDQPPVASGLPMDFSGLQTDFSGLPPVVLDHHLPDCQAQ